MTLPHNLPLTDISPYKGTDSYQVEDQGLFFGRDQDAEQLLSLVIASPATLLHAASGAGKTSLLNARLIPEFEALGWIPVRVLPLRDPLESTRMATLEATLPPPQLELVALRRARRALADAHEELSLEELLARYDERAATDSRSVRRLIMPFPLTRHRIPPGVPAFSRVTPMVVRLLRSSIDVERFAAYLSQLGSAESAEHTLKTVSGSTSVRQLELALGDPALWEMYRKLVAEAAGVQGTLKDFFENLVSELRARSSTYGTFGWILIFDQFEEMFTRFVDSGPSLRSTASAEGQEQSGQETPGWQLRKRLFKEMEELHTYSQLPSPADSPTEQQGSLAIRFVISMRNEYVAHLDQLPRLYRDVDRTKFHLRLLERHQALAAIQEPARNAGYEHSAQCVEEMIGDLIAENRFVEPAHIQVVCHKLWDVCGRTLVRRSKLASRTTFPRVRVGRLRRLQGARGILRSALSEYIEALAIEDRMATLDVLGALLTSQQTRSVVEKALLLAIRPQDIEHRKRMIERLVAARFVREENRYGVIYVEISHEFLIEPILAAITQQRVLLRSSLIEYLTGLDTSDRHLALDILHQLMSREKARILVEMDRILDAPFRPRELLRSQLLELLRRGFLRSESRAGTILVEIAHDSLIEPIVTVAAEPTIRFVAYVEAVRLLERYQDIDFRLDGGRLLTVREVQNLNRNREHVEWQVWAVELMLRSIIYRDPGGENGGDLLQVWAHRYADWENPEQDARLDEAATGQGPAPTLSLEYLRLLRAYPGADSFSEKEIEMILRSEILKARSGDRDRIIYWTRRLVEYAD